MKKQKYKTRSQGQNRSLDYSTNSPARYDCTTGIPDVRRKSHGPIINLPTHRAISAISQKPTGQYQIKKTYSLQSTLCNTPQCTDLFLSPLHSLPPWRLCVRAAQLVRLMIIGHPERIHIVISQNKSS